MRAHDSRLGQATLALASIAALATCNMPDRADLDEVEMISQKAVTYPAIDFSTRPSGVPNNVIGLTFDDGPDNANTPRVLDTLLAKNVKATFFINTDNFGTVDSDTNLKNIIKRIVNEGHQLASHTVHHLDLATLSTTQIRSEITGVQTTVNRSDVLGASFPKLTMLRAPFGSPYQSSAPGSAAYDKVAPIVGEYAVHMGWAIDTFDYNCNTGSATQNRDCVINSFKNKVKTVGTGDYGLVLMHSVQPQTADAIGAIIDYCRANNFVFWQGEQFVQAAFGRSSNEVIYGTPPTCTQTPFGGAARAIPGTIQAEDYDNGGNNCAYMDTTSGNQGNAYRTTEAVDVQATTDTGGGFNIGFVQAGEYLDYTVNVSAAGNFKLELRVSATATGKTVDVFVGGTLIADNLAVPNTGAYQTFATISVASVALTAGTKELKVVFNQASQNLNWIKFTAVASCTPESNPAFCSRLGKNCGTVTGTDNCGASRTVTSCGTCTSPQTCNASNVCETPPTCTPESNATFCSRLGKNCGSVTGTDNCGTARTVSSCGTCTSPQTCNASNVCQAPTCTPESNPAFCSRLGKNCGTVTGTDNCGTARTVTSCGTCTSPQTCNASNVCQAPSGNQYTYFEAEAGSRTSPLVAISDASASGGQAIWSGTSGSNGAVPATGHATFSFSVTTAGTFQVWGRFLVGPATTSDDSLWARIDSGTWTQWNDIFQRIGGAGYGWDRENNTITSGSNNVLITRNLTAGNHTLEVAYRENGLKMDRFLVTNDLAFVPSP